MADEKKKLEFRDVDEKDGETYLTKSRAQLDLERRTAEDYKPDAELSTAVLNPNPFGEGEYVGTDPIYQNASTKVNAPGKASKGAEADLVKQLREDHKVEKANAVEDPGTGGVAEKAGDPVGGRTVRTILPGQEGYDLKKAEEQNGPPLRVFFDDEDESESEKKVTEVPNPGTNFGATTENPDPDKDEPSKRAGSRSGE